MASAGGGMPPEIQSLVDIFVGGVMVSTLFSYLTCGILLCYAWYYYSLFPTDPWFFKALVVLCLSLCIAETTVSGIWLYDWTVSGFGNIAVISIVHWALIVVAFALGTTSLLVQCFYAWRVWMVSVKKNWFIPGLIVCLSLLAWSVAMWIVHTVNTHRAVADLGLLLPIAYIWLGGSVAADMLITFSLFYYLDVRLRRDKFTTSVRKRCRVIILNTIECNALSLVSQIVAMVLFNQSSIGFYFVMPDMVLSKVYTFSLLASLIKRNSGVLSRGQTSSNSRETHVLSDRRVVTSYQERQIEVSIQVQNETNVSDHDYRGADKHGPLEGV